MVVVFTSTCTYVGIHHILDLMVILSDMCKFKDSTCRCTWISSYLKLPLGNIRNIMNQLYQSTQIPWNWIQTKDYEIGICC
jgi:hypothetical protein